MRLTGALADRLRRIAAWAVSPIGGRWYHRYLKSQGIYVYRGRVSAGGQEKGVDVSLAVDLVRATYNRQGE